MKRAFLLAAGILLAWLPAGAAWGHALLDSSEPSEGALLDAAPSEVRLTFTEAPDTKLSVVDLLDQSGVEVQTPEARPDPSDPRTLVIPVGGLQDGVYTVSWRVLSTVDGHVTAGTFGFGVGVDSAIPPPDQGVDSTTGAQRPSVLAVAGRWGFYWGAAALLGLAAVGLVVFGSGWRPEGRWVWAACLLAAVGLVGMLLAERSAVGVGLGDLLGSDRGRVLALRAGGLVLVGVAALVAARRATRLGYVVLAATAGALMLVQAYAGHAGGATSLRWAKVGVQWLHLLGVGLWIGGLVWLWLGTRRSDGPGAAAAVERFSGMATVGIGLVVLTGALRALDEVGFAPARYFEGGFSLSVVAKVALFLPLAALGALNRFRTVPALVAGRGRIAVLRRAVGGEIVVATLIFAVSGLMAGLVPASQARAGQARPAGIVVNGSDFATTVRLRLRATPGTPGPNSFELTLRDYDTGEPVPARRVTLRFSQPENPDVGISELPLRQSEEGIWRGQGVNLATSGTWRVAVLIEQAADSLEVPLELTAREPPQKITRSEIPGEPTLYTIELSGFSVQGYVDPGDPGENEVHFTFFSPDGGEQPIESWVVRAGRRGEEASDLEIRELAPGHVVADASLEAGAWRFRVEARTPEGRTLTAYFDEEIGG